MLFSSSSELVLEPLEDEGGLLNGSSSSLNDDSPDGGDEEPFAKPGLADSSKKRLSGAISFDCCE